MWNYNILKFDMYKNELKSNTWICIIFLCKEEDVPRYKSGVLNFITRVEQSPRRKADNSPSINITNTAIFKTSDAGM